MIFDRKTLNKNVPIPLYYQLKELILEDINSNKYLEGDAIPTEIEISNHFGISRPTVRQAINELVNEGYLYRVKGKGTFLSKPKIYQEFTQVIDSFNEEMKKKGLLPRTKVIEFHTEPAPEHAAQMLNLKEGSKVHLLKRLRFADNEPILIVNTYIPFDMFPELIDINFEKESLYKILAERNLVIKRVRRTFEARKANENDAKLLEIDKDDPIHYFETIAYLSSNTPIEYSISRYRGDRNKFVVEITR